MVPWEKLQNALLPTSRGERLLEFFREITIVHMTCRVVKAGTSLLDKTPDRPARTVEDPTFHEEYGYYLRETLFVGQEVRDKFYRQAVRAVVASLGGIEPRLRTKIKTSAQSHHPNCYMCNVALDFTEKDPIRKFTAEHLWPQSYGGDSSDDNLLPACGSCNSSKKRDFATWGMVGLQGLILGLTPNDNEVASVEGTYRYAMHYYAARQLAVKKNLTLKRAFQQLRPWGALRIEDPNDVADFFNMLNFVPVSERA